jgi:hypothetical protein
VVAELLKSDDQVQDNYDYSPVAAAVMLGA